MFVAGETSGDLHAAGVAAELRARIPALRMVGVGGERMRAEGVELIEHAERLAVIGAAEVVAQIPRHWRLLRRIQRRLKDGGVSLVVLIDYPGFNLRVARAAHAAGVPVLYYITPQVWAWGAGRLSLLARVVTRAAVILPFEEKLLREHGIDATFVGHPLLDRARQLPSQEEARRSIGLPQGEPVLALFPGSRTSEIRRHLDPFVEAAREAERLRPGLHVIVSQAPGVVIDPRRCPYPLVSAPSYTIWRAATAAFSKSGTSTLEAAVAGCPLVIAYRTSSWTYALARRMVRIPHIGLVNVVAGREVAPEFVQGALRPLEVGRLLAELLDEGSERRNRMVADLAHVKAMLGEPGASAVVGEMAAELLK
jgi:lipid-A-disaccharide synthase